MPQIDLTPQFFETLKKRLQNETISSNFLNAIPGKNPRKLDIHKLRNIRETFPQEFVEQLLSKNEFSFLISSKDLPGLQEIDAAAIPRLTELYNSLDNLFNENIAYREEHGINIFGFGFPMIAFYSPVGNKPLVVAPLFIWQLTLTKEQDHMHSWRIDRNADDPIYTNEVFSNYINSNLGINNIYNNITPYNADSPIDQDTLLQNCKSVLEKLNNNLTSDLITTLQRRLSNIVSIPNKEHFQALMPAPNNARLEFSGLLSLFKTPKRSIIQNYDYLITNNLSYTLDTTPIQAHNFQSISSVKTDPTQQSILNNLQTARNLLIQGPPGTGKSQTLSAILVNALENSKKVLVVCEKRTALEVLFSFMNNHGLHDYCVMIEDVIRDKGKIRDKWRQRIEGLVRNNLQNHNNLQALLVNIKDRIDKINKKHGLIGNPQFIGNKSWGDIYGTLMSKLREQGKVENIDLDDFNFLFTQEEYKNFTNKLSEGETIYSEYKKIEHLQFFKQSVFIGNNLMQNIANIFNKLEYYIGKIGDIKNKEQRLKTEYINHRNHEFETHIKQIISNLNGLSDIFQKYQQNSSFTDEKKTSSFSYRFTAWFSGKRKQLIRDQRRVKEIFTNSLQYINQHEDLRELMLESPSTQLLGILDWTAGLTPKIQQLQTHFDSNILKEYRALDLLGNLNLPFVVDTLSSLVERVNLLHAQILQDNLIEFHLPLQNWRAFREEIESLSPKLTFYINNRNYFVTELNWRRFFLALDGNLKSLVNALKPYNSWEDRFSVNYFKKILGNNLRDEMFEPDDHYNILKVKLQEMEIHQINHIKSHWDRLQLSKKQEIHLNNPKVDINHFLGLHNKNTTLKKYVTNHLDVFTTFFPIIFTTPGVASNLFEEQTDYFDIVLFDEASQLTIQDTIPALTKGKQKIISGDEHQMPPSNYFNWLLDDLEIDRDDNEAQNDLQVEILNTLIKSESLLHFVKMCSFQEKNLIFHYRSQHPYLIDFSNHAFYESRLKPLPQKYTYTPIKWVPVNGIYQNQTNESEANAVVRLIQYNIFTYPDGTYPSIGIATFNQTQRNLIRQKIHQEKVANNDFRIKMEALEQNGFFVKNLENIQGDERDVIIISTTYGRNAKNNFSHLFGPINNTSKGHRLLNVIFTRAKYKIYICTSIPEIHISSYSNHLNIQGNKGKAILFSYLEYAKAVSEGNQQQKNNVLENLTMNAVAPIQLAPIHDSPFEKEVYQVLLNHFGEAPLETQYQFAGFRIDILFDAQIEGVPKIAIECDGATYHSSPEAYLYDLHRQKILENHGFVFHRIWSPNWWNDRKHEENRLVNFIRHTVDQAILPHEDDNPTSAFGDNVEWVLLGQEPIEAIEEQGAIAVGLNSRVTLEYVVTNEEYVVQIVNYPPYQIIQNGVERISINSPLATHCMGKTVSEEFSMGGLQMRIKGVQN